MMRVRAAFIAGLAALAVAAPAQADTWTVTSGSSDATTPACNVDLHTCVSLRTALAASEATKEVPDTINVPAGTININNDLVIQSDITVVGTSARTNIIDGGAKYRGFRVMAAGNAKISHFTVRNGAATQADSADGGGILNLGGVVQLDHVRVTGSRADNGAGIANFRGNLSLQHSLVDNNTATGDGGGIANIGGPEVPDFDILAVADSTVHRNTAGIGGTGGISSRNAGSIASISRSTVADNTGGARGIGGISLLNAGNLSITASIVARNLTGATSTNCGDVKPTDGGANVENDKECDFDVTGATAAVAATLTNAGGEVDVLAITAASPAVDLAPVTNCNAAGTTDQRKLPRPQGPRCDAGAFELDVAPTVTITSGPTGTINTSSASFTFSTPEPGVTYQCRLTGPGQPGTFVPCDKPGEHGYGGLANGSYTFSVRALDGVFANPPAASRSFTIVMLDTSITAGPSGATNDTTPTFTFTGVGGAASFQCRVDNAAFATCTSPHTTAALTQGAHTFEVRALNATGAPDATPASRAITVDSVAPDTTIATGPSGPTNAATPTFTFGSGEAGVTFSCSLDGGAFVACSSPFTAPALAEGAHVLLVRAHDASGNVDASPASRPFSVDLTPPPAPTVESGPAGPTTDAAPAFAFSAAESVSVSCRLDGPAPATGAFGECTSPKSFGVLAPGEYVFIVRSVDAAGNANESRRPFAVTLPVQATPTPTPSATPTPTPTPPTPTLQTVVVQPTGTILVRLPGTRTFVPLDAAQGIPYGAELDTRKGKVRLTTLPKSGAAPESAEFFSGIFTLHKVGDVTELRLSEKLTGCKPTKKTTRAGAAQSKKPKSRKLWGDGKGKFRTRGQYSAATVRGTRWLVQDNCTTTLTRVTQGVVAVKDFTTKKTVLVKKGKRYTTRPKRR